MSSARSAAAFASAMGTRQRPDQGRFTSSEAVSLIVFHHGRPRQSAPRRAVRAGGGDQRRRAAAAEDDGVVRRQDDLEQGRSDREISEAQGRQRRGADSVSANSSRGDPAQASSGRSEGAPPCPSVETWSQRRRPRRRRRRRRRAMDRPHHLLARPRTTRLGAQRPPRRRRPTPSAPRQGVYATRPSVTATAAAERAGRHAERCERPRTRARHINSYDDPIVSRTWSAWAPTRTAADAVEAADGRRDGRERRARRPRPGTPGPTPRTIATSISRTLRTRA